MDLLTAAIVTTTNLLLTEIINRGAPPPPRDSHSAQPLPTERTLLPPWLESASHFHSCHVPSPSSCINTTLGSSSSSFSSSLNATFVRSLQVGDLVDVSLPPFIERQISLLAEIIAINQTHICVRYRDVHIIREIEIEWIPQDGRESTRLHPPRTRSMGIARSGSPIREPVRSPSSAASSYASAARHSSESNYSFSSASNNDISLPQASSSSSPPPPQQPNHPLPPVSTPGHWTVREKFIGKKSFGYFHCIGCRKKWVSAHSFKDGQQRCRACERSNYPELLWVRAAETVAGRGIQKRERPTSKDKRAINSSSSSSDRISSLPSSSSSAPLSTAICCICTDVISDLAVIRSCAHTFDYTCIMDYLEKSVNRQVPCPHCRTMITKQDVIKPFLN
jgi:hypothetical protein